MMRSDKLMMHQHFPSFRFWTVALVVAAIVATPSTLARAETPYEQARRINNPTVLQSVAQLRANFKALDGMAVELGGEVTGVMTRENGRVVLLKVGDDMAVLNAPPALATSHLLRAGVLVRLLARMEDDGRNGTLTILAATEGTAPAPKAQDAARILLADVDSNSLTTPMSGTVGSLPQPPSLADRNQSTLTSRKQTAPRAPAAIRPARPVPARPSAGDVEEMIDSQIPSYAAIVRRHNKKLSADVVQEIATAILRAGLKHNMDPRFLAAVIAVESDFDVYCLSRSGAMGLGQIMPFNLKEAGIKNAWNPTENIMGCAKLLRGHLNDYKNRPNATLLAVAAYNAGPGAVRRAGYKVPNGAQVQRYVWKVYFRYKAFAPDMF